MRTFGQRLRTGLIQLSLVKIVRTPTVTFIFQEYSENVDRGNEEALTFVKFCLYEKPKYLPRLLLAS